MAKIVKVSVVNRKQREDEAAALVTRLQKGSFRNVASVLTKAHAATLDRVNIICKSDDGDLRSGVLFFTDDYCMGTHILHKGWVHCSMGTRGKVVPRPSIPDGKLHCLQDTLDLYYENYKVLETIEEVAMYIVKDHSYNSEEEEIRDRDAFKERSQGGLFRSDKEEKECKNIITALELSLVLSNDKKDAL
jgi:hypothetical protein